MPYFGVTPSDAAGADLDGKEFILDADADTTITADTDDTIDIKIAGADDFQFTANTFTVLSGSTLAIASGATIANSGTATGFSSADPASADGDSLGTASAEWSDLYLADGGVIYFGNAQDVTLTHNADTSLTCNLMVAATTFEPTGDTAAGDNAAIGYTASEGLILTGQGSTDDITIKNDADTTVVNVATGATDVEISAGNILFGTGSKGVYLGVTSATAANLLDDYEEGSWTPALTCASSNPSISGGSAGTGKYRKIGSTVFIYYSASFVLSGVGSGVVQITGLPFTAGDDVSVYVGSPLSGRGLGKNGTTVQVMPRIAADTTGIKFNLFDINEYPGSEVLMGSSELSTDADGANWYVCINYIAA